LSLAQTIVARNYQNKNYLQISATQITRYLFKRRFWTRNRPGDTILDKTDELHVPKLERATGIIFKNIDLQSKAKI
jgi:hypothetical protein